MIRQPYLACFPQTAMKLPVCTSVLLLSGSAVATTFPCSISVEGFDYDLCPLLHSRALWNISTGTETPPTFTMSSYAISLRGPLQTDKSISAHPQCAPETWICLIVENTRPDYSSEPPRVLQIVAVAGGSVQPTARLGSPVDSLQSVPPLVVHLHGGSWANRTQKAVIQFHCAHDAEDSSEPQFSWSWNGTHAFTWTSRHACPRNLPKQPPTRHPDSDSSEEPPSDPESNKDTNLQDNAASSGRSFLLFIVFVTTCLILIFLYPNISQLLAYTTTYHFGFRLPAVRLLRWVQQAGFDDEDEELDYMVNSEHDRELERDGEEIPLTPSPRYKRSLRGSAPGAVVYGSFE